MAQIYTKDKGLRITFRCDSKLGEWIKIGADNLGMSPSSFVRQSLYSTMSSQAQLSRIVEEGLKSQLNTSSAKAVNDAHNLGN